MYNPSLLNVPYQLILQTLERVFDVSANPPKPWDVHPHITPAAPEVLLHLKFKYTSWYVWPGFVASILPQNMMPEKRNTTINAKAKIRRARVSLRLRTMKYHASSGRHKQHDLVIPYPSVRTPPAGAPQLAARGLEGHPRHLHATFPTAARHLSSQGVHRPSHASRG